MVYSITLITTTKQDSQWIVVCEWITYESATLRINQLGEERNNGNGGTKMPVKITCMINHRNKKCNSRQGHIRQDLNAGMVLITPEQPKHTSFT